MKLLLFALTAMFLTSCGKFSDGTSVWADFVWVIPTLSIAGCIITGYKAYKAHNSGSWKIEDGATTNKEGGKKPYSQIGWTGWCVFLAIVTIAVVIYQNSQK